MYMIENFYICTPIQHVCQHHANRICALYAHLFASFRLNKVNGERLCRRQLQLADKRAAKQTDISIVCVYIHIWVERGRQAGWQGCQSGCLTVCLPASGANAFGSCKQSGDNTRFLKKYTIS